MTTTLNSTVQLSWADDLVTQGQMVQLTVGDFRQSAVLSVGIVEVIVAIDASIGNAGFMYCKNHDATAYVDIGYATGDYKNRLYATESALIPLLPTAANVYIVASEAATKFQYVITERP